MAWPTKQPKLCCVCAEKPRWVYGRCPDCLRRIDPALFERLKNMTRAERAKEFEAATGVPEHPRWEYVNEVGEAELIAKQERKDRDGE